MLRSLWSGSVAFGLVNIPVKVYVAIKDKSVGFHMMSPDGACRLRRKLYCPETDTEYDFNEATRGIEIAPDQYVIVDKKEIDKLKPEKGETLEIEQFVDASDIDPIYFEKSYYLGPAKGGKKAYQLLRKILEDAGKVAIGRFVMRTKEYLVALRFYGEVICLHTLNYANEVLAVSEVPDLDTGKPIRISEKEKKLGVQLVESMTSPFDPAAYKDRFTERVKKAVEEKSKGRTVAVAGKTRKKAPVIDLMEALQKSVKTKKAGAKEPRKRAG